MGCSPPGLKRSKGATKGLAAGTGQLSMRFVGMSIPFPDDIWEINEGNQKMKIHDAS